jgi:hypothetical protein
VKRAIKLGLIDAMTVRGKCTACMVDLGETPELQHILLSCTRFDESRQVMEGVLGAIPEALPPDDRTQVLLGGGRPLMPSMESDSRLVRDGRA